MNHKTMPGLSVTRSGYTSIWQYDDEAKRDEAAEEMKARQYLEEILSCDVFVPIDPKHNLTGNYRFDRQTDLICNGNILSKTQYATYVRARTQMECNGIAFEHGHLQAWDLNNFGRNLHVEAVKRFIASDPRFESKAAWMGVFFHRGTHGLTLHGALVTGTDQRLIRRFDRTALGLRHSSSSIKVLDAIEMVCTAKRVTNARALR